MLFCALPIAMGQSLPDLGDVSQSDMPPQMERRLGESIMREIRADPSYSNDPEVTDYLNTLGYKLVAASADSRQQFNFFLIMDPQVNAFALPGGFVGINSGLMLTAQSESELAGVVSHEVAHVTQRHMARMLAQQKQSAVTSIAALALAVLAARANPDLGQAAMAAASASSVQSTLNYTRDHEREADRVGFQVLEKAGFDVQGMAAFFERMQRATRFYETNAPAYLRTHPITYERIADMQNRAQNLPYKQVPDSIDFQLMRAKLKSAQGTAQEAVAFFEESLAERKYLSEAASRYGLVTALMRAKSYGRAGREYATLRRALPDSPAVDALAGRYYVAIGDTGMALQTYRDSLRSHSGYRALVYEYAELLLVTRQAGEALKLVESRLPYSVSDYHMYELQAKCYAALGKRLSQHRASAEAYYRMGNLRGAIDQLMLAQKSGDGDFYQQSSVDARLRELRLQDDEVRRESRK
ncbi:MAG: peptidase Ste24p [Betaproteobacteria bacterium]|nr:peptidase Ste24p [Betaproteobacteria bacterium]